MKSDSRFLKTRDEMFHYKVRLLAEHAIVRNKRSSHGLQSMMALVEELVSACCSALLRDQIVAVDISTYHLEQNSVFDEDGNVIEKPPSIDED